MVPSRPTSSESRAELWLDEHGDGLFRFALARVRKADVAEDLVQETLLAALNAIESFRGQSSERTWLVGILKRKLVDWFRKSQRTLLLADLQTGDDAIDARYDATQHMNPQPGHWGDNPARLLERREFWSAFDDCRERLPDRLRLVFSLRMLDQIPASEICQSLEISAENLWTLLHRARLRLWNCLDSKGLAEGKS